MEPLKIQCPKCGAKAELSIDANAEMVLLNCFKCKAPILYFHGETTLVDEVEMGKLQDDSMKAIEGFLKIHPKSEEAESFRQKNQTHAVGEPLIDHPIRDEDIADLKIDLHYSEDVLDFLKKL
jgi:hypothetical protein